MMASREDLVSISVDRLLANAIVLHEVSSHEELIPEIPAVLKGTLAATHVVMVLVGMNARGTEVARSTYTSSETHPAQTLSADDWVNELLAQRIVARAQGDQRRSVTRPAGEGRVQVLCELETEHAIAFDIQSPGEFFTLSETGRAWLKAMLENMAHNLALRLNRPSVAVCQIPPLSDLTRGEWRILLAIDSDDSEKEIASKLGLSTHTIHSHIKNVYRILRVRSRLEAISMLHRAQRLALLQELLPPEVVQDAKSWHPTGFKTETGGWAPILQRQREIAVPLGSTPAFGRLVPKRHTPRRRRTKPKS